MRRIEEFTGLRAVAVGAVVLGHARFSMPPAIPRFVPDATGDIGVQIFFVLSGYLITRILMAEAAQSGTISLPDFYRRRALRILPAFYMFILVISGLALCGVVRVSWQQIAIAGTGLWNYAHMLRLDGSFAAHPQGVWYLGHSWSLALEAQFYLAWPATFLLIRRRNLPQLLPAVIFAVPLIRMTSYVFDPHDRVQLHLMFHTGMDALLAGCLLALHQEALAERLQPYAASPRLLTLSLFTVAVTLNLAQSQLGGNYVITYGITLGAAVVAFMMLSMLQQPSHWFCRLLRTRVCLYGGRISYSLYLWQQVFDNAAMPIHLRAPLGAIAAIGCAVLSYHFIERPFLNRKTPGPSQRIAGPQLRTAAVSKQ